jgi:hypothetical protein
VEVVAEDLDPRDRLLTNSSCSIVAWEQNKCNVTLALRVQETRNMTNLQWGFAVRVDDLGCVLQMRLLSGIHEFLKEDFGKDAVSLFLEQCRKDDGGKFYLPWQPVRLATSDKILTIINLCLSFLAGARSRASFVGH